MNYNGEYLLARMKVMGVMFAGFVLAMIFGMSLSSGDYLEMIIWIGGALFVVWIISGRNCWWVPFPAAMAFGGYFYIGFKVYSYEIALALCLLPLFILIMARKEMVFTQRTRLPFSVLILALYILLHWATSIIVNYQTGARGAGNVSRLYLNAAWPFILFFPFYIFGMAKYLKLSINLMFWAYLIRALLGILFVYLPDSGNFIFIPIINFVPSSADYHDLRFSCVGLLAMALGYFSLSRRTLMRIVYLMMALIGIWGLLVSGGRVAAAIAVLTPLFWAAIQRNYASIILAVLLVGGGIMSLVLNPDLIHSLPENAQRSVTLLISDSDTMAAASAEVSDKYHRQLKEAGLKHWLTDETSILVGHTVKPLDVEAFYSQMGSGEDQIDMKIETATENGRFESGLFQILGTLGLVGLLLYVNIFRFLILHPLVALWKEGIASMSHVIYFLAVFYLIVWIIFCYYAGDYPSQQLMLALFAYTAWFDDKLAKENAQKERETGVPVTTPVLSQA